MSRSLVDRARRSGSRNQPEMSPEPVTCDSETSANTVDQAHQSRSWRRRAALAALIAGYMLVTFLMQARAELGDETVEIGPAIGALYGLAWGDMDSDGDLDIAVSYKDVSNEGYADVVYVQENVGSSFSLKWKSTAYADIDLGHPAWGDYDNDGDLDLAVGHTIFANQGSTFVESIRLLNSGENRNQPTWVDFNNDGYLDLSLGGAIFVNNHGLLSPGKSMDLGGHISVWGDIDGDSDQDVAILTVAPPSVEEVRVLTNVSGAFSQLWGSSWEFDYDPYSQSLDWGDMDGDGDLDLVMGALFRESRVFRNDGVTFAEVWTRAVTGISSSWGDWNNDGYSDLAFGTCVGWRCGLDGVDPPIEVFESYYWYGPDPEPAWRSAQGATRVSWVDWDSDGDLDLSSGLPYNSETIYINRGTPYTVGILPREGPSYAEWVEASTWGNFDGDTDPELLTTFRSSPSEICLWELRNEIMVPKQCIETGWYGYNGVASADWDADGDLDLAIRGVVVRNNAGTFEDYWSPPQTLEWPVWVDWDGDGLVDLLLRDLGSSELFLFRNDPTQSSFVLMWQSTDLSDISSVSFGDWDNDGDPDLAVGRGTYYAGPLPSRVYENVDGEPVLRWEAAIARDTVSIEWGDVDQDGDLDLALSNIDDRDQVYLNQKGDLEVGWESADFLHGSLAWVDVDSDGDLDLVRGGRLHVNNGITLDTVGRKFDDPDDDLVNTHWADWDSDGDVDAINVIAGLNTWRFELVENHIRTTNGQSNYHTYATIKSPGAMTEGFGVSTILENAEIPIHYTLHSNSANKVGRTEFFYSLNGGGQWLPAQNSNGQTSLTHLAASIAGVDHTFYWDTSKSGLFGLFDNVIFRIDVYDHAGDPAPAGTYRYPNAISRSYQRPARASARTTPFRVRGTQVKVVDEGGNPVQGAMVYRLKSGEITAEAINNGQARVFTTDRGGYLQGHGELNTNDQLFALLPVEDGPNGQYTVYHTSGTVTVSGPAMHMVPGPGTQELTVSADNPLILYNLIVSLEWDARNDSSFMSRLEQDIVRASQILYDLTDGQAALGRVDVHHDKGYWGIANVVIPAGNNVRPAATLGGIVHEPTDDVGLSGPITGAYVPGQVRIGATWNRFGDADGTLGEDWPRALAHELGHYLFFLPDNYIGLEAGKLTLIDCPGSAMSNPYLDGDSEFLTDNPLWWTGGCLNTVAERFFGRADWETIDTRLKHAGGGSILNVPGAQNTGPTNLPLGVTKVKFYGPNDNGPRALAAPFFPVQNESGQPLAIPAGRSQAFLIKQQREEDGIGYETAAAARYVVALGSVVGDLIQARGAAPGDQLCVFDYSQTPNRSKCIEVEPNVKPIRLEVVSGYQPFITVKGLPDSKTVEVTVTNAESASALSVQVLPALGAASNEMPMTNLGSGNFKATVATPSHAFYGYVRVWVPDANPMKETILAFTNLEGWKSYDWGGYAYAWGDPNAWGGYAYAWGGYAYAWGGYAYAWGAPVMSNDGQVSVFPLDNTLFSQGSNMSLQTVPVAPVPLPPWLTQVSQAYRLEIDTTAQTPDSSLLFRYLARDVPDGQENNLRVYYLPVGGTQWQRLADAGTQLDTYRNHVAAKVINEGIYTLVAAVELPPFIEGWNTFAYPVQNPRPVEDALASIEGKYRSVYHFNNTVWKLFDPTVVEPFPAIVNDFTNLEYPKTYWIYATEPITATLPTGAGGESVTANTTVNRHFPPATYYGWVTPGSGFTPAAGMTVTALIDGVVCGNSTVESHNDQLAYVVQVQADIPGAQPDCGYEGQSVVFNINGQEMAESASWNNSQAHLLDLTTPGEPMETITLTPIADSYTSANNPTSNYGGIVTINVKEGSLPFYGFLKFDTSALACAQIQSATLRLYTTSASLIANAIYSVDSNWTEMGVNWNNDPAINGSPLDSAPSSPVNTWVEYDVTAGLTVSDLVSFGVKGNGTDVVNYSSREGTRPPELVIKYTVTSSTAPTADFSGSPRTGNAPLDVLFTNASTGCPTSYLWNFGDDGDDSTSTQTNPTHRYAAPGTYTVSLTASNAASSDVETKTAYITVNPPLPSSSLYVTPTTADTVGGVSATPQDILFRNGAGDTWAMHFNGIDVGVTKPIAAFARLPNGDLLLVFKANQVTPAGTFTPWDVARFTPSSLGNNTAGTFSWYFDGSDVGLTVAAEKIDALDALPDGRLLISTTGAAVVPGLAKQQDEDVLAFTPGQFSASTSGTWSTYFDGTPIPGLKGEDLSGAHVDPITSDIYATIVGDFVVGGIRGNDKDVIKIHSNGGSSYTVTLYWRGPNNGFNLIIGGFELP